MKPIPHPAAAARTNAATTATIRTHNSTIFTPPCVLMLYEKSTICASISYFIYYTRFSALCQVLFQKISKHPTGENILSLAKIKKD
jgi:hypothetical protein